MSGQYVASWVKELVENQHPKTKEINGENYKTVISPKQGDIVYFKPFHNNEFSSIGEFYKVEIIEGSYWGMRGVSNFWYWYRLNNDGSRNRKEHGYGAFYKEFE